MKKETSQLVGLCQKLEPLRISDFNSNEVRVTIARKMSDKSWPQNWSMEYDEPRASTGGCFARIFGSMSCGKPGSLFGYYGPEISYGDMRDYEHAARAMKRIGSNHDKMWAVRGSITDTADAMGRFLEASGVTEVWLDEKPNRHSTWLKDASWQTLTIGSFIYKVRECLPEVIDRRLSEAQNVEVAS